VIVTDFDILSAVFLRPFETDAPLIVDPYWILPCPITFQLLEAIGLDHWWPLLTISAVFRPDGGRVPTGAPFAPQQSVSYLDFESCLSSNSSIQFIALCAKRKLSKPWWDQRKRLPC